jgi:hypothetical protein
MATCTLAGEAPAFVVAGLGTVVSMAGPRAQDDLGQVSGTIRYTSGETPVLPDQDPLTVARAFVQAWLQGDCDVFDRLSASGVVLTQSCAEPPGGSLGASTLDVLAGSAGTATIEVDSPDGSVRRWRLGLVAEWSAPDRAAVFRIDEVEPLGG